MELRSADPSANPYLAFALLIYAGLDGIDKNMIRPEPVNVNLYTAGREITDGLKKIPQNLEDAKLAAEKSNLVSSIFEK
jgi:glutamine synthetase